MTTRLHHFVLVLTAVALLSMAQPLTAQIQGDNCSRLVVNRSFSQGFEGFLNVPMYFNSFQMTPPPGVGLVPSAGAGFVTFLPHGKVKGQVTLAIGVIGLLQDLVFDDTSKYSLAWDTTKTPAVCAGTVTLNASGETFNFQLLVPQDGRQIEMIHTDTGLLVGVTGFPMDIPRCSNNSLNGKYLYNSKAWALAQPGDPFSLPPELLVSGYYPLAMSGAIEFHAQSGGGSSAVWWDTVSINGAIVPRTGTGSYSVNPDCTGTMVLTDPTHGQVFHLELFVGKYGQVLDLVNVDTVSGTVPVVLSSHLKVDPMWWF